MPVYDHVEVSNILGNELERRRYIVKKNTFQTLSQLNNWDQLSRIRSRQLEILKELLKKLKQPIQAGCRVFILR